tara:strand:- start:3 stop:416 length:414 start_codon:yes stop_codon:yes gene_type:complete
MNWIEKRDNCKSHQIKKITKDVAGMKAGSSMLIANTLIFDKYINNIPYGEFIPTKNMRIDLALKFNCDVTCPLTTGIFIRVVSEASYQEYIDGKPITVITPFWRVVSPESNIAKKLACGIDFIIKRQEEEKICLLGV